MADTMSDQSALDLEALVLACLDAADPDAELDRRTSDRPDLRPIGRRILARVRANETQAAPQAALAREPESVGPYHIVRKLGAGGMGAVYLAEQHEPLVRTVAVKLVKLGMDTDEVLRRFELERQTLALMNHDNIARVYDAGRTPLGQPYFVMEYVPGTPLATFADRACLDLRRRLALFLQVCAGVQHAHQRGVVHRDLKPANILVVDQDGTAVPKIIDFGLARVVEKRMHEVTLTVEGCILGTPAYMSPEQTGMDADAIDTRTDVYALGVILYELLTGLLPFSEDELLRQGFTEMLRLIRQVEPSRPSRKLAMHEERELRAELRGTTANALVRALSDDLDWIVMTALRKERDERYASVSELAADVRRYLADEPVLASAPSALYRARKLLKRHRVAVATASVVFLSLVIGLFASLWFFFDARASQIETQRAKDALDPVVLLGLRQEAEHDLWPVHPNLVPRIDHWLSRADALAGRRLAQQAELASLGTRGKATEQGLMFDRVADMVAYRALAKLVADLDGFFAPAGKVDNVAGVRDRRQRATTLVSRTLDTHRQAWQEACAAIKASDGIRAHRAYAGLELVPQLGLVPIGLDSDSKLWEFYHPDSGEDGAWPVRDAEGRLAMTAALGFVFVLLPGGTFLMGRDQQRDPSAETDELPRHQVSLAPFFVSKFECTQAQWRRLQDGDVPSHYHPGFPMQKDVPAPTWMNPVENVLWQEADAVCRRYGFALPTEAQWEYACRAGADTIFAWGDARESLAGRENIADAFAAQFGQGWSAFEAWEDGHVIHAPVGSFKPNSFGLFDMHGNITEMCADLETSYEQPGRPGDGLRTPAKPPAGYGIRIGRGGCWQNNSFFARCADRQEVLPRVASDLNGFRPARAITGAER